MFNTNTNKIEYFVEEDTLYSEATLKPEVVSRWLSPDPLAAKYPSISPYVFGANNPIFWIDPDGRDIYATNAADRELVNSSLKLVLGTAQQVFSLNNDGKLEFHGNNYDPSQFTSDQNLFIKEFNDNIVSNSEIKVFVHHIGKGVGETGEKVNISKGFLRAPSPEQTISEKNKDGTITTDIFINDDVNAFKGVLFEDLKDQKITKMANNIFSKDEQKALAKDNAPAVSFFHGIGHALREIAGDNERNHQRKTVSFENLVRRIIKAPERYGENHGGDKSVSGNDPNTYK